MDAQKRKHHRQLRRRNHVRRHIEGTAQKPRLSVFRSSKHIYAQLIDDVNGVTVASAASGGKAAGLAYGGNVKAAEEVGKKLAAAALAKGITHAAFDRGHYRFHGRVRALALAATAAGLKCSESKKPPRDEGKPTQAKPAKGEKAPKAEKAEKAPKGDKPEKADKGEKKPKPEKTKA
jgi:large subunit ribosomal protein L18